MWPEGLTKRRSKGSGGPKAAAVQRQRRSKAAAVQRQRRSKAAAGALWTTLCDAVAAIRRKMALQAETAALEADEIDRREMQEVVSLMKSLRADGRRGIDESLDRAWDN